MGFDKWEEEFGKNKKGYFGDLELGHLDNMGEGFGILSDPDILGKNYMKVDIDSCSTKAF